MSDCRECAKCVGVREGEAIMCKMSSTADAHRLPWFFVTVGDCDDFEPKPAPASPPASADLEGANVLDVLREVRDVLLLSDPAGARAQAIVGLPEDLAVAEPCKRWGYGAVMDSAARQWRRLDSLAAHTTGAAAGTTQKTLAMVDAAISSEEARRARPDPRDAAILALANALILARGTLNMFEHGRPFVTSAIASINEAVRLPVVDKCLGDADLKGARLAAEAQEGRASR